MSSHGRSRASGGHDRRHRYGDHETDEHRSETAERYRERNRRADRLHRERERERPGNRESRHRNDDDDDDDREAKKRRLAADREERMARLRDQLRKEDETLAELDRKQAETEGGAAGSKTSGPTEAVVEVRPGDLEGLDEEEQMRKLLGFDGFGSTKGEAVEDNHSTAARGGAAKNKARKYRQYMNRKSGFNRPLEKMN
ncbi:unnamed protein product [Pseudo-nitzschia multistriata]|uniref:U4/U6.U5 small nuclear ribonucleoprotein 27kDa protein domain-containing protein n=1 Tax=Pseudo-nitzschia multistriata TaxID=183589 RepID=A0A448ZKF9_9STRA|nr:unnamed protein product [Pseudo-nitzschia multistriata]